MLKDETKDIQESLAKYCRTNEQQPLPGVVNERLHHYRRLIYNIIDDAIESAYPIARKQFTDKQWEEIITLFVKEHKCAHSQLFKMPKEFIDFSIQKEFARKYKVPFLYDLLLFEWVEIDVHTRKDEDLPKVNQNVNILQEHLCFTPYMELIELEYPVHLLKQKELNISEASYYLIYREETGTVQYLFLSPIIFSILIRAISNKSTILNVIETELNSLEEGLVDNILSEIRLTFEDFRARGIILGAH